MKNYRFNTFGGLLAILLWSTTFALARSLSEHIGAVSAGAAVYLVGGFFCAGRLLFSRSKLHQLAQLPRKYLFGCGSLFILYTVFIYFAVGLSRDRTQLLQVALLNYLWPALTILLSVPLLKKSAGLWLVPGTVLALAGVFLVMTRGSEVSLGILASNFLANPVPYALALGSAICWAAYSNLARLWSGEDQGGGVEIFIPVTGLVLLSLRLFLSERTEWNLRAGFEAATLGAITSLAYVLWDASMRKGNLLLVAACAYFTPLLSTVVSCVYLKVLPGPNLWTGCALLVIGSLLSWRSIGPGAAAK